MQAAALFENIPHTMPEPYFRSGKPTSHIPEFLSLGKKDVARATKISESRVRYDAARMPGNVEAWLSQVGITLVLVTEFFKDEHKTKLWFDTPNPQLGDVSPIDMIKMGRVRKLLSFVQAALEENKPAT